MPKSKKTAASATVTKSAIDHATSTLEDLPEKPKENWSLREAVSHLQVQISSALSKGYSYEEVARMLTEKGIEISASSLKSYLSAAKRQKETAPKTGRTGRRSRKALAENLTVIEEVPALSSVNGTAAKSSASLNGAAQEPLSDAETADSGTTKKRRTRSSTKSSTASTTNSTRKSTAAKTAAKSKSTPRTQSTAKGATGTRSKRQRQA